ncbi:MAG: DUF6364 family protein [Thermodesulfobacteriota bacterium]
MKQNITLSIDEELLKKGKILAAKKDTSVSKMLSELLKTEVENDAQYEAARKDAIRTLKNGFHMGGKVTWRREDLYAR